MANFVNRTKYYLSSLTKWPFPRHFACPNCGSKPKTVVDRKYLITTLARCDQCKLLFRQPTDTRQENTQFYAADYTTHITDTPLNWAPEEYRNVEVLRKVRDYSEYVRVLNATGILAGRKVLDFGCSWGYGTAQIREAGFAVTGYEISGSSRRFARDVLGIPVIDDFEAYARHTAAPEFDIFFSSHVLEHLPELDPILKLAKRVVRPGGIMMFFVPNGSDDFRAANPKRWRRLWGEVHPFFLTADFFGRVFSDKLIFTGSTPIDADAVAAFMTGSQSVQTALTNKELVCIVKV